MTSARANPPGEVQAPPGCDVAVVGAGPAGAMAALSLAQAGVDVAILDRSVFPRDKVCGDALLPDAVQALDEAGLAVDVRRRALKIGLAEFRSPGGRTIGVHGEFLTIRRHELDALLLDAAVTAGARFLPDLQAVAPAEEHHGDGAHPYGVLCVRADGTRTVVRCRVVVLACGSNPRLLASFGVLTRSLHSAIAIRAYLPHDPFPAEEAPGSALLISYERSILPGYGWSFPLPGRSWNVGCGVFLDASRMGRSGAARISTNLRALLDAFLSKSAGPRESLGEARGATLRTGFTGSLPVRDRVLVTGEALGLTLPLTGDGIGKAMQSGLLAGRALKAALDRSAAHPDLRPYADAMEARTRSIYRAYGAAQKWMRVPAVSDFVVRRAARSRSLRGLLEEIVAERTDPRTLLSPVGLLRAAFL